MAKKILLRRDLAANWTSADPVLAQGEPGFETDTAQIKIGDGTTAWTSLPYVVAAGGENNTGSNVGTDGVGVFDGKVVFDLQFRHIAPASNKVTVTLDAGDNDIDIDIVEANIDHDALFNFIADEHIAHSGVVLTAGAGLAGGGDITTSRTFDVDINSESSVTAGATDEILIADASDTFAIKKVTAQSIANLSASILQDVVDNSGAAPQLDLDLLDSGSGRNLEINANSLLAFKISRANGLVDIGDPGTEVLGINVGGTVYDVGLRINDVNGVATPGLFHLHKHSTTLPAVMVASRSNSNTSAHAAVTASQNILRMIGAGWTGSHYDMFGDIVIGVSAAGTISPTSSPGRMLFRVTPDGSDTPEIAISIEQDKSVLLNNFLEFDTEIATPSTPATANNKLYFKSDAHQYRLDDNGKESLTSEQRLDGTYAYNADGSIDTITWSNGEVDTYTYNADGSIDTISNSRWTVTYAYNADGSRSGETYT